MCFSKAPHQKGHVSLSVPLAQARGKRRAKPGQMSGAGLRVSHVKQLRTGAQEPILTVRFLSGLSRICNQFDSTGKDNSACFLAEHCTEQQ